MSYTDLRDFAPEYTVTDMMYNLTIQLEKLGGGTVGKYYTGAWRYIVKNDEGEIIAKGQDFVTNLPRTHIMAACELADMIGEKNDE